MGTLNYNIEDNQKELQILINETLKALGFEVNIQKVSEKYIDDAIGCYQL